MRHCNKKTQFKINFLDKSKLSQVRNQLLNSHSDNIINDEELLLLYDVSKSNNLNLSYHSYPRFNLDDMSVDEA